MHAGEIAALLPRQPPRGEAGRQRELVVAEGLLAEADGPVSKTDLIRGQAQPEVDPLIGIPALGPEEEPFPRHLAQQVALRKRRALIGRIGFRPDEDDLPRMPFRLELARETQPRLSGSDHDDPAHYPSPLAVPLRAAISRPVWRCKGEPDADT